MAITVLTKNNYEEEVLRANCRYCWTFGPNGVVRASRSPFVGG